MRLELVYPSGELVVTARRVPDCGLAWEPQLRAWFESFPPAEPATREPVETAHRWHVDFGSLGEICGGARSEADALEVMRALVAGHPSGSPLAPSLFRLSTSVRRSPYEADVYTAEVDALTRLDELPAIVHGKREKHEQWR